MRHHLADLLAALGGEDLRQPLGALGVEGCLGVIFEASHRIHLDVQAVRTGLAWAQSWTPDGAILCTLGGGNMRLTAIDQKRFLATWATPMPATPHPYFFLIPRFIVQTLSSAVAWNATGLEVALYKNLVGIILREGKREFRLSWRWSASEFNAPRAFARMNQLPENLTHTPYVSIADIIHLAIANLLQTPLEDDPNRPGNDAILLDFMPSALNVDGEAVRLHDNHPRQYYFNSKMVIRGLEIVRENQISFAIQPIRAEKDAILYLACQRKQWQIHCALLALGVKAERMPAMQIRETRPPMMDGAWVLPPRS
jgi:hypothetical protein